MPILPHPCIAVSSYALVPLAAPSSFSLMQNGVPIAMLEGDWAERLYQLSQGEGTDLNCYQAASYILNGTTAFDGPLENETNVQGSEVLYKNIIQEMSLPIGIQWITKNMTERNPEGSLDHLHSAVLVTAGSEESAIVFEIPGYHYPARFATLSEVHAREMQKANAYQTVRRHFYS